MKTFTETEVKELLRQFAMDTNTRERYSTEQYSSEAYMNAFFGMHAANMGSHNRVEMGSVDVSDKLFEEISIADLLALMKFITNEKQLLILNRVNYKSDERIKEFNEKVYDYDIIILACSHRIKNISENILKEIKIS